MKIYDWHIAPNPRRLHIYLAEKGIEVPLEEVSGDGFRLRQEYVANYPHAMVPMLELDDGTQIGEAMAIARYFEETHPEPPLMGTDAKDKAIVEMWEKRANEESMLAASELFRNTHPDFADRGLPGSAEPIRQLPELITRGKERLARFFKKLDEQLADNEYVAGSRYTIADITALCGIDFAGSSDVHIPPDAATYGGGTIRSQPARAPEPKTRRRSVDASPNKNAGHLGRRRSGRACLMAQLA